MRGPQGFVKLLPLQNGFGSKDRCVHVPSTNARRQPPRVEGLLPTKLVVDRLETVPCDATRSAFWMAAWTARKVCACAANLQRCI